MIVYKFGALKPTEGFDLMRDQLRLGHRYRNALVELELYRRAATDFLKQLGQPLDPIKPAYAADQRALRKQSAVGPHGEHELVIPKQLVDRFRHAEQLRGQADQAAAAFLGDARRRTRARREALRHASDERELGLVRFDPATADPNDSRDREHWARRDRHLYQWERDEYNKALRARAELYRTWVHGLAALYGELVVEDFDIRRVLARSPGENPHPNHVRFLVAPSTVRLEAKRVFGERAHIVKARSLTQRCSACKHVLRFDAAVAVVHCCERCGAVWDQDANNARNQLTEVAAE